MVLFRFVTAMYKFIRSGCLKVSPKARQIRLDTCKACPKLKGLNCSVCGCFVHLKSWCATEECPEARWAEALYQQSNPKTEGGR
jgi:hypothetical protein